MEQKIILEMQNITKIYPNGVVANKDVQLTCREGEIHALMGENGAGKSTLMKILFGVEQATHGKIILNGQEVNILNPMHAISLGIGMVHQHFMLDEQLTVTENIILGMEPKSGISIDYKKANQMVLDVSKKYNLDVNPEARVMDLDIGKKQKVEILKALIRGAKLLIMDEPTAVLTPQETRELFEQLKILREDGHTIIFISHKLNEIKYICDRATIMRSGTYVGSFEIEGTSIQELSRAMIGRDIVTKISKSDAKPTENVLQVNDIIYINDENKKVVDSVSLKVRKGEILGIAGVEGNGQREFVDCVTGLSNPLSGTVTINNMLCSFTNATLDRREKGLAHIPEDRIAYGCMVNASIEENLIANRYLLPEFNNGLLLNNDAIHKLSAELIKGFEIKTDSPKTPVRMLSGGNMQKVVVAREMSKHMDILVADQPTRGIDVGTAALIHKLIVDKRNENVAVLLVSADINEVLELSDSIVVFYDGKITAYFENAKEINEEKLGLYMLGLEQMDEEVIKRAMT